MARELVHRTTIKDCEVETFRCGGKGGQNQNKRDTGVRVRHRPSGAVGESREERSQLQNKKRAFVRMAESAEFQTWARKTAAKLPPIDAVVDEAMAPGNLFVEAKDDDGWVPVEVVRS
jgi:protein subunit release factor B